MGLLFNGKWKATGKVSGMSRDLLTRPLPKDVRKEFQKKNPYTKI